MGAAMLAVASIYLSVWLRRREDLIYLMFVLLAIGGVGIACTELWMMKSTTAEQFRVAARWFHPPTAILICAFIGLVYFRLESGRRWLALTICGTRFVAMIISFLQPVNLNYSEITSLRSVTVLGESIAVATSTPNPWMLFGNLSNLLVIVFVFDATASVWRRTRDTHKVVMGIIFCGIAVMSIVFALLTFWEVLPIPSVSTPIFFGFTVIMGVELGRQILRSFELDAALIETNAELRDSEQRLNLAAEAARAGLWSMDAETGDVWATSKAREILAKESVGNLHWRTITEHIQPDDLARLQEQVDSARESGHIIHVDFRLISPAGETRWLDALASWHGGRDNATEKLTGVVMDVTANRDMERTASQQQKQLTHLSRAATLNELSASLAHEINQPLGMILSNAEAGQMMLGADSPDIGELREIMDDIVAADRRAAGVISGLRALSKQEEPDFRTVALNDVIIETMKLLRGEFRMQDVSVDLDAGRDLPPVRADRTLLVQVILNLLTNACDAVADNPPGGRKIKVCTRSHGQSVQVTISDNGVGLEGDPERLFDPYFTTKESGLGMGLAITRSIIKSHNGRVWADSDKAAGTNFHLSLPPATDAA
jgi:signal transduction histidine kinase